MKKSLLAALILLFSGCAEFNAGRKMLGFYGADAADQTLGTAIYGICKGVSVGAIDRRFQTQEAKDAWIAFCAIQ